MTTNEQRDDNLLPFGSPPEEHPRTHAWFACTVEEFVHLGAEDVLPKLTTRSNECRFVVEATQAQTWWETFQALQSALRDHDDLPHLTGLLIEFPLLRLHRRIDVILLRGDVAIIIEVKGGEGSGLSSAIAQVEDYALMLRDFHEPCRTMALMPIAAGGPPGRSRRVRPRRLVDKVAPVITLSLAELDWAITQSRIYSIPGRAGPTLEAFDLGAYRPTPDIVSAAKEAYSDHEVKSIRRRDAPGIALEAARARLREIVTAARLRREHVICFITGTPGAGKTLLGLDLVLGDEAGRLDGEPAALLSGNRPLVRVLQDALIEDEADRTGAKKKDIKPKVEGALQTLLGYLREHTKKGAKPPPEHVVVFDEAQRAWDEDTGMKLLKRKASEPELFLGILRDLDWACLVCLVGGGQEINRGELGLPLWVDALIDACSVGDRWRVVGPDGCLEEGRAAMGLPSATSTLRGAGISLQVEPSFRLQGSLRAHRNQHQTAWLDALLRGELEEAFRLADRSEVKPAYLCRELNTAKAWLRHRRRGDQRVGLLASSGAVRLRAVGLPPSPMSNDLSAISHWFLKPTTDFRSSNALETPLSEYAVQGLEVDYAGVCWGGDLIWQKDRWVARQMRSPKWSTIRRQESFQHRLNSYRVLLSRSRAGQIIFVPRGDSSDPTRSPQRLDAIAAALHRAGCPLLSAEDVHAEAQELP